MEKGKGKGKGVGTHGVPVNWRRKEEEPEPNLLSTLKYTPSLCCYPRNHPKVRSLHVEMATIPFSERRHKRLSTEGITLLWWKASGTTTVVLLIRKT
jgi:hypothetical protein